MPEAMDWGSAIQQATLKLYTIQGQRYGRDPFRTSLAFRCGPTNCHSLLAVPFVADHGRVLTCPVRISVLERRFGHRAHLGICTSSFTCSPVSGVEMNFPATASAMI